MPSIAVSKFKLMRTGRVALRLDFAIAFGSGEDMHSGFLLSICIAAALLFGASAGVSMPGASADHGMQNVGHAAASIEDSEQFLEASTTQPHSSHCGDGAHASDQCTGAHCCSSPGADNVHASITHPPSEDCFFLTDYCLYFGGSPFTLLRPPRAIA